MEVTSFFTHSFIHSSFFLFLFHFNLLLLLFLVGLIHRRKVYIPTRDHPEINFLGNFLFFISFLISFVYYFILIIILGLIIGPRGRSQKDLEQRTGAKIIIRGRGSHRDASQSGHPDDNDELHVCIEGPEHSVNAALAEIEQLLFNPQQALRVKEEQLRNLHAMQTSLQLYVPAEIQRLGDGEAMVELEIPNHLVGYLIGKGGENIHKMQNQTGVHVLIAKESDMKPGETLRSVILRGTEAGVAEAKRRVDDLVKEKLMGVKTTKQVEQMDSYNFVLKVPVPNDKVGVIIGKGGAIVKGIQERTNVLVHIPPGPDEDNKAIRTLSICGDTRESVDTAQMEIFVTLQQQQQQTIAPVNALYLVVPDDKVGVIIGRSGVTIKDIQSRYNVKVQIPQAADPGTQPPVRTIRYYINIYTYTLTLTHTYIHFFFIILILFNYLFVYFSIIGQPQDQYTAKFEIENLLGISTTSSYGGYGMPDLAGLSALAYGTYGTVDPYAAAAAATGYGASAAAYAQQGMTLGMTTASVIDPHHSHAYINSTSNVIPSVATTATTTTAAATTTASQSTGLILIIYFFSIYFTFIIIF